MFNLQHIAETAANAKLLSVNVEEVKYFGSSVDALNDAHMYISEAASAVRGDFTIGKSLVLEAALNTNLSADKVASIQEGVFGAMIERVKTFFKKMAGIFKGLSDKLKADALAASGQSTKWASMMKKPVNDNLKHANTFVYEGIPYTGIASAEAKKVMGNYKSTCATELKGVEGLISQSTDELKLYQEEFAKADYGRFISTNSNKAEKNYADIAKRESDKNIADFKKETEKEKDRFKTAVYGRTNPTSVEIKGFKGIGATSMLEAIENLSDVLSDVKNSYDDAVTSLTDIISKLESIKSDISSTETQYEHTDANGSKTSIPDADRTKIETIKSNIVENFNLGIAQYSNLKSCVTDVNSLMVGAAKDQAKEFMNILSKFARYKGEKK